MLSNVSKQYLFGLIKLIRICFSRSPRTDRCAGDYRIVYHLEAGQSIRLDYADLREEVYEAFKRLRALRELQ